MNRRHRIVLGALAALLPALALPAAAADCPSPAQVEQSIRGVFKRDIGVTRVSPSRLAGLCEVQVTFQGRPNIVYTDPEGAYFVTGHIVDAKAGVDLTQETLAALSSLSADEMKEVASLATLTVGTKGPVVYFATDPMWPYCKKAGPALKKLAEAGEIQVKVLMYPLDIHKGAREMCISVICDKKGFDELEEQYKSDNQCAEGIRIVDETIAFLKSKGIGGTPTYIFANGQPHSGLLDEEALRAQVKAGP